MDYENEEFQEHGVYYGAGKWRTFYSCDDLAHAMEIAIAWQGEVWTRVWFDGEIVRELPIK